jgi:hypothetical protein
VKLRIIGLLVALAVAALSTAGVASARDLKQGTFQLSGQSSALFGKSTIDVEDSEVSDIQTFNVEVEGVYHVIDNFGIGLLASYDNTDFDPGEVTSLAIGPVVQVSLPMSQMANFRLALTGGYATAELDDGADDYDTDGFFYGGSAAFVLFPADFFSVDLGVRWLMTEGETDDSDLDLEQEDISAFVGISVYF